jgi:hypothetical protein
MRPAPRHVQPTLVILDLRPEGRDGVRAFLIWLRGDADTARIPALIAASKSTLSLEGLGSVARTVR